MSPKAHHKGDQDQVTYLDRQDINNFSVAMHIGFGEERQGKHMKIAACIALYAVLLLIWMPGFKLDGRVYTVPTSEQPVMRRKVLRPPAEQPLERVITHNQKAKKVPMPDLTPDAPEPLIAAVRVEQDLSILTTDTWEGAGIPEGPPRSRGIAMVGNPGVGAPVFTRKVQPDYPIKGLEIRLQGYVILQAILRKDGSVDDVEVLRGLGRGKFGFETAAVSSLRQWEFIPGTVNGEPADVRMNLRVDFVLN